MRQIIIKNGMLYDGLGGEPYLADIQIEGERIKEIRRKEKPEDLTGIETSNEENEETDRRIIDASGRVVTPGFIDIHRHCDVKPFFGTDFGDCMIAQGITTTVVGNCGISMTPCSRDKERAKEMHDFDDAVLGSAYEGIYTYRDYMEQLETCTLPVNMAAMIGTGSVKITVKGFADTPFNKEEMKQATQFIKDAMEAGAPGVSVGLMYLPECYSNEEEYGELLKPVGEMGGVAAFHIRGEGDSLTDSIREAIEIGKRAGCAVEISHFKSCGMNNWKREIFKAIKLIDEARKNGQDVSVDFYPYEGGSTALTTMLPPVFVAGNMKAALEKLGTKEGVREFRKLAEKNYDNWDNYCITLGWNRILISGVSKEENRKFLGLNVEEAAKRYGFEDAYALAAFLMHEEDGKTAIINLSMCEEDIETVAKLPYSIVISDSIYANTDTPHPRMYGAFPKIIRSYVRERKILSMEEAIKKMTSMPAKRMHLKDRGVLAEGMFADINVFAYENFQDHADFLHPTELATGLDYCIVNGTIAFEKGKRTKANTGRVIRIRNGQSGKMENEGDKSKSSRKM